MPLFSSYKTALKQELNGEKWDVGHLSALGWAISVRCSGVQCWEEFCCNNSARIILNHASDISYAQPWWVSLVCHTCVDCSPGVGTRPWSKSSWTAASCWCWAPPCPWCPKCWVSVSLLACLCVCLFSLSVPTVVWSDSLSAPLPCPRCSKCWVSVWLLVCLCVCLLSPSPLLFGQTLSLHRFPARGVQNVGSLSGCLSVFSLHPHCCLVRLFLCTAALLLLACFPQSNGLKNAMQMWWIISLCPALMSDRYLTWHLGWSVLPCLLVWPVICQSVLPVCLTCHVGLSDLSYCFVWPVLSCLFDMSDLLCCFWPVMPVWHVWPVMLSCLTCCIFLPDLSCLFYVSGLSCWSAWPVVSYLCDMSDLSCWSVRCHTSLTCCVSAWSVMLARLTGTSKLSCWFAWTAMFVSMTCHVGRSDLPVVKVILQLHFSADTRVFGITSFQTKSSGQCFFCF